MPTSEQRELRQLAHEFAEAELRPHTAAWDERRALDDDVFAKLAELGFLGMLVPEEHGGLGFDLGTYLLVLEELAWGDAAVARAVAIHNGLVATSMARHGSEAQRSAWLPRLAAGEALGAFALSESDVGSDASSIATRATAEGGGWRLDGEKRWVTNGARAGVVLVFAKTAEDEVGAFLVEPATEGYDRGEPERTLGLRASETVPVRLDGVRVSAEAVLGQPDAGYRIALEALDLGRVGLAAQAVGVGRAALEHATRYALEREQFDQPIARFGAVQAKLAEMARRLAGARALTREAAAALEAWWDGAGPRMGLDGATARAAIAKVSASEAATWTADEAIQIHGGYGYMRHYPVEKLLRDAKGAEIYEGTNEIMRMVIAREILRDAGDVNV